MNIGKIVQIIGPVVDVLFSVGNIPAIYQALTVEFTAAGRPVLGLAVVAESRLVEGHLHEPGEGYPALRRAKDSAADSRHEFGRSAGGHGIARKATIRRHRWPQRGE